MQDADTITFDITSFIPVIAQDIKTLFGVTMGTEANDVSYQGRDGYATVEVDQSFGVFAMIVDFAEVKLHAAPLKDGSFWVQADLSYKHPGGGRNGSPIGTWWLRDGAIENFRRP